MKKIMLFLLFCTTLFAQEFTLKKEYSITESKNFFFGAIENCLIFNNKLYVSDTKKVTIYEFDKNGKFIRNIGRKGRGPGEFAAGPMVMLAKGDTLLVVDNSPGLFAINYFNKEMKYIKKVYFKNSIRGMTFLNNSYYVVGFPSTEIFLKLPFFTQNDINFKNGMKMNLPGEDKNPIRNGLFISSSKTNYFILTYNFKNKIQVYKDGKFVKEFAFAGLPKETPEVIDKERLAVFMQTRSKRDAELLSTDITEQIFCAGIIDEQNRIFLQPRKEYTSNKPTVFVYNVNGDKLAVITALGDDERILYAEKGELYTKSKTFTTLNKYKIVIK